MELEQALKIAENLVLNITDPRTKAKVQFIPTLKDTPNAR